MNANHDALAHLATKAELAEVAAELRATLPHLATKGDMTRMLMWLAGILVACMLGVFGLFASLTDSLQQQQNAFRKEVVQELAEFRKEIRQDLGELRKSNQAINARLIRVEAEVSKQSQTPKS